MLYKRQDEFRTLCVLRVSIDIMNIDESFYPIATPPAITLVSWRHTSGRNWILKPFLPSAGRILMIPLRHIAQIPKMR